MKLKFSILLLSAAGVLFSSCEPRDSKITRPDTRAGATSAPGTQANGEKDNYKYIAMLAERQVEAIELYRALTDAQYATEKNITIEDVEINGTKLKKVSIKAELKSDAFELTRDTVMLVNLTTDENGQINKISASETKDKLSIETVLKKETKTDVSLKNTSKHISIEKTEDGSWASTIALREELNLTGSFYVFMLNSIEFKFTSMDANQDVFKISNVKLKHQRYGLQSSSSSDFEMVSDANTTMTIALKTTDKCASISGVLDLDATKKNDKNAPLYQRTLAYDDKSNVVIKSGQDNFTLPALDCEFRLPVDLGKIL